jgi:hypothetical protein
MINTIYKYGCHVPRLMSSEPENLRTSAVHHPIDSVVGSSGWMSSHDYDDCFAQRLPGSVGRLTAEDTMGLDDCQLLEFGASYPRRRDLQVHSWISLLRKNHVGCANIAVAQPLGPIAQQLDCKAPHTMFLMMQDPIWEGHLEAEPRLKADHDHTKPNSH